MKKIIVGILIAGCAVFSALPLFAGENAVGKDVTLRWNYLTGISRYTFAASKTEFTAKDGIMVEMLWGREVTPFFHIALAPGYWTLHNEFKHKEILRPGVIEQPKEKYAWHIESGMDAFSLAIRPNFHLTIANIIDIGLETGFGVALTVKTENWSWSNNLNPITTASGAETIYGFDPFYDLGAHASWLIDDESSLGINFNYFPIYIPYGHFTGGTYYRGGLFYQVKY